MNVTTKRYAKILIQKMIKKDMEAWPPECFGWLYQAQRPLKSEKQIKRLIERYHHNKTIEEIAHLEGVTRGSVNESIQAALAKLRENCEVFA